MADKKKQDDPTITTSVAGADYPEGTHPVRSPSQTEHSPDRLRYEDAKDKPDPSTVAQVQIVE